MRLREEVVSDRLYYRFLDDVDKDSSQPIGERITTIERNAEIFREIEDPDEDTEVGWRLARIKELDFVTVYPFLMALRENTDGSEFAAVLEIIESFIVRRLICGLSTRGYGTFFVDLMNAVIGDDSNSKPRDRVRTFFLKSDAEGARWPNDAEFEKAWTDLPLYNLLARARLRFILTALEEHLRKTSGLTEPFAVPVKLEVEHVMPQSWEANWPLPPGQGLDGAAAQNRRSIIQTIGNLTLLTKKLNITLSNAGWSIDKNDVPCKQKSIKAYSLMMLSKCIVEQPDWSELAIRDRSKALFTQACKIWPHP
jgi:hypothetical protein